MKRLLVLSTLVACLGGCSEATQPVAPDLSQSSDMLPLQVLGKGHAPVALPLKFANASFRLLWAVERDQEVACGGAHIAGGAIRGTVNVTHLGKSTLEMSAAWNIGNLLGSPVFVPTSPHAGGPAAPVLGVGDYPYSFHFNPFTQQCGSAVTATGQVVLTAANGHQLRGVVTGGETHRLDFVNPGDGIETFANIDIVGGTGRFADASGSFTAHTITRFDYTTFRFVIDLAEVLPGGTLRY